MWCELLVNQDRVLGALPRRFEVSPHDPAESTNQRRQQSLRSYAQPNQEWRIRRTSFNVKIEYGDYNKTVISWLVI